MKLHQIAKALGGTLNGRWINIRGPNHSSADRSLGFQFEKIEPDGLRIYSFAGDDPVLCKKYVKARLQSISTGGLLAVECDLNATDESKKAQLAALAIWEEGKPPQGTPVEAYLAARRCPPSPAVQSADALRFSAACPFGQFHLPAMIAPVRDVRTGKLVGIHRTALADDGTGKREMPPGLSPKMMMGRAKGGAVMLQPAAACLGIAEGIETALSAHIIFEMPVWAALSAPGVRHFPIIPGLKQLTVFADHDEPGLNAACDCAERYSKAGIEVEVRYPQVLGSDWNDYLTEQTKDAECNCEKQAK